jgi:two-component system OmpR family sensor kinase
MPEPLGQHAHRRHHSMRATLLLWLAAGLTLALALVGVALYLQARAAANQLFDEQMRQVASAMPSRFLAANPVALDNPFATAPEVVIQIWDPTGVRLYFSHDEADLPQRAVLGFSTIEVHQQQWRVYSAQHGPTVVQIAQPLQVRSALAARAAAKTVAPLLLLVPFLGALIWIAVSRGLAPIHGVAAQLAARDAGQLAPLADDDLPDEIRPLTHAVNALFARLDQAAASQRIFIDDAAHELRTPLTALQLQVGLAQRATDAATRDAAFTSLRAGLERAARLVQQLLTLARHERGPVPAGGSAASDPDDQTGAGVDPVQNVDLTDIARTAVADLALQADLRGIDLGLISTADVTVMADAEAVRIMIGNLLDNALHATPSGGRIDVTVDTAANGGARLTVDDTGSGIPATDLERVFDRFYRAEGAAPGGSGLGLAIVRRIADMHHASVILANRATGLRARVVFPAPLAVSSGNLL